MFLQSFEKTIKAKKIDLDMSGLKQLTNARYYAKKNRLLKTETDLSRAIQIINHFLLTSLMVIEAYKIIFKTVLQKCSFTKSQLRPCCCHWQKNIFVLTFVHKMNQVVSISSNANVCKLASYPLFIEATS